MAAMAASLMGCGVAKCGSPAPKSTRSTPLARSLSASFTTARVAEISIRPMRSLSLSVTGPGAVVVAMGRLSCRKRLLDLLQISVLAPIDDGLQFIPQLLLHRRRYQALHRAAQGGDLAHQPRAEIGIR